MKPKLTRATLAPRPPPLSLCPLIYQDSPYLKLGWTAISWFSEIYMKTPAEGAATSLFLLCADGKDVINGGYYSDCKRNEAGVCALYSDKAFTAGTAGPRAAAMMLGMKKIGDAM